MIDEHTEELASLYVLDLLGTEEARAFEETVECDAELQRLVDHLQASAASLSYTVAQIAPPPGVKTRLMAEIGAGKIVEMPARASRVSTLIPWALAAGFAIFAGLLLLDRQHLQQEKSDLAARNALAEVQLATLTSMLKDAPNATAAIAWDEQKQRGILRVSNMPAPADDQDYQLWVVDPQYEHPVSAGVFHVEKGTTHAEFTPDRQIGKADKFAISVEQKGGVPVGKGPIVMLGQ